MSEHAPSNADGLTLDDVSVRFRLRQGLFATSTVHAVTDATLTIEPGTVVGLVGESGCGKTTLARTVTGLQSPTDGSVHIDGTDLATIPKRARQRHLADNVAIVFQDPSSSLNPRLSVRKIVRDPLEIYDALGSAAARNARVDELINLVGLSDSVAERRPGELSGGQRQRVAIARALALNPRYLIADEPTSALDVSVRAQVLNLIVDLRKRLNLGMLYISHDIQTVRYLADRIAVMYLGRIVEQGSTERMTRSPRHPYTHALFSATPSLLANDSKRVVLEGTVPSARNPPTGCPFRTRCPRSTDACANAFPQPTTVAGRTVHCVHPLDDGFE